MRVDGPAFFASLFLVLTAWFPAGTAGKSLADPGTSVNVINLGTTINTKFKEAMPCISGNGKVLIYQTNRIVGDEELEGGTGEENWDLWVSYLTDDGRWTTPSVLEGVNSDYFDGHASLSVDGRKLYFASNRPRGGQDMNIWFTQLKDGEWTQPKKLSSPINTEELETFPSVDPSGKTLYFTRQDGIYVSVHDGLQWGVPEKLSKTINAGYEEAAPAIHVDGRTLYFSSKRPGGLGGYDLYLSRRNKKGWGPAINLGRGINGPGNDLFVSIPASGKYVYFASERKGGFGGEDLYQVDLPPMFGPQGVTLVTGRVFHEQSGKTVPANFEIIDLGSRKIVENRNASPEGQYNFVLTAGIRYGVVVSFPGFYFLSDNFDLSEETHYREIRKDFKMVALGQSGNLVLSNIFFGKGSANILPESRFDLERLAELLKKNSFIRMEVQGHTDNKGASEYNRKLSEKRAEAVKKFLVKAGVRDERLTTIGYGDTKPVATNDTEEGRGKNRRTEFRILK